jgi:phosphoribosylanthranilate isomerase
VLAKIKFCGMTRAEDAAFAAELGAGYIGVIFAESPRRVTPREARTIFDAAGKGVKRVGVFGTNSPDEILRVAGEAELDVAQLHADPTAADVIALRDRFPGEIWAAVRIGDAHIPPDVETLLDRSDAIVLDARSQHLLGGTGQALPWSDLAGDLARLRGDVMVVLAGGLNAENVVTAIRTLAPDVADVSSGVEDRPGEKNHRLMAAFAAAVIGSRRH